MSQHEGFPSKPAPPTGSDMADAEHGIQLGLLDATITALAEDASSATELLEQLYTYSEAHFLSEQLLMRMAARANYEGHVEEHSGLMQDLDNVRTQVAEGQRDDAHATLEAHQARLLEHIRSWDQSI